MNPCRHPMWRTFLPFLVAVAALVSSAWADPNLVVWDTGVRLQDAASLQKADWQKVPSDLFKLEADPLKSSSDPGYYGREYSFRGDLAVENSYFVVVFLGNAGKVVLFSKAGAAGAATGSAPAEKIGELSPISGGGPIRRYNLIRNSGDEVAGEVYYDSKAVRFTFGKDPVIEWKADEALSGIRFSGAIEVGVLPSFVGDDILFTATESEEKDSMAVPAENALVALMHGEKNQVVFTWPNDNPPVHFRLSEEKGGERMIGSIDIAAGANPVYIAPQSAAGIWHRETLNAGFLEKDLASSWRRPFPARWQTQLVEAGVKTRFAFHDGPGTVWRGVPGSYNYPVWFDGDRAFYHLSKKVPPKGRAIVYFLEGQDTPWTVLSPADVIKTTLGRARAEQIIDLPGRKLRTHHRRGGAGVRRACTCGCTEAIQAIFEAGEETARKDEIREDIADMIYFVKAHVERIEEYRAFAQEMIKFLQSRANSFPDLKPYLEEGQQIAEQLLQEYEVQKENMKSPEYADELVTKTMRLTERKESGNLSAYMELLKAWRGMGGAQDYVVAQCHTLTRKLFQQASYGSANNAQAVPVALEIRKRCRDILRNADGYEIWPNY